MYFEDIGFMCSLQLYLNFFFFFPIQFARDFDEAYGEPARKALDRIVTNTLEYRSAIVSLAEKYIREGGGKTEEFKGGVRQLLNALEQPSVQEGRNIFFPNFMTLLCCTISILLY